jgi:hypothetical protein
MGYHGVNMSGFVHRVAAMLFENQSIRSLTVGRKIFLRRIA